MYFPCEFFEISKNIYLAEHLREAASVIFCCEYYSWYIFLFGEAFKCFTYFSSYTKSVFNPFHATGLFLILLKTLEKLLFPGGIERN